MRNFRPTLSRFGYASIISLFIVLALGVVVASAIESEGETFSRGRLVGNLGVVHADVGVYPDRSANGAEPERTTGSTTIVIPDGAEVVEAIVYWVGRGSGWSDPNISLNGTAVTATTEYSWSWPSWDQTTYVADLSTVGVTIGSGTTVLDFAGLDHDGGRFYGVGVTIVFEHPSLPEIELELLEGNEFAFFDETFFDAIGNGGTHTSVTCASFASAIEARQLSTFTRIMGVDAGRGDGPARSQRLQWWSASAPVVAPVVNGLVGIPALPAQGSVDNPVTPRVSATDRWGVETFSSNAATLAAGDTNYCNQMQSVDIGDGVGASISLSNQGVGAAAIYRVGNLVWFDQNDDGIAQRREPGIDGIMVELWRQGDASPLATTDTADDGSYLFEGLLCGAYSIVIPGAQTGQSIAGSTTDLLELVAGSVVSSDPDDDLDNDNNGLPDGGTGVASAQITLGDCGDDGDFSNGASAEPTNETNRVGGPDDDPNEVSTSDGNYDDVRSNTTVDFAFVETTDTGPDPAPAPEPTVPAPTTTTVPGTTTTTPTDPAPTTDPSPGTTTEPIDTEVAGQAEDADLAATGASGPLVPLGALIVLVTGVLFVLSAAWIRPLRR